MEEFRVELAADPEAAWRKFIDRYTPTLLAAIERIGITDRDEAMEIYVRACERLAANNCVALRRWDPSRGAFGSWLSVVVRRVAVDWVRSRAGRRRLFGVVKRLPRTTQRIFELYYWQGLMPSALAQHLSVEERRAVTLEEVFDGLSAIDAALSARHRSDLLSLAARARPVALDDDPDGIDAPADTPDPEQALERRRLDRRLEAALARLPAEDAAIVSLRYIEGLGLREIERLLRIEALSAARVQRIVAQLRAALAPR